MVDLCFRVITQMKNWSGSDCNISRLRHEISNRCFLFSSVYIRGIHHAKFFFKPSESVKMDCMLSNDIFRISVMRFIVIHLFSNLNFKFFDIL